jgi:prephenate dehydrogenase
MEIGIYGLGRFGSFFAARLAGRCTVKAWSRDPGRPAPRGVQRVGEEELLALPAVFLCVAISALPEVLERIAPRLAPGTLVMDTCSVKSLPVAWMQRLLPPAVDILASHPLFGPDSAAGGFEGLPMILWPVRLQPPAFERWRNFFGSMGLAVHVISPEEHDRQAAYTQGLTHYLGRVLAQMRLEPAAVSSLGYRKLLEIIEQTCNDSWQLFLDLQRFNPYTPEMRQKLDQALEALKANLDTPGSLQ